MKNIEGLRVTHSYVKYDTEEERRRAREEAAIKIYKVLSRDNINKKEDEDLYINVSRTS